MITEIIDTLKYQTLLEEFEEEYDIELNGELIVAMARVDLKKLKNIISNSDNLVENFKVGRLDKFGLDYEGPKVENPKLIYYSVTGFRQDGPCASRAGCVNQQCQPTVPTWHAWHTWHA